MVQILFRHMLLAAGEGVCYPVSPNAFTWGTHSRLLLSQARPGVSDGQTDCRLCLVLLSTLQSSTLPGGGHHAPKEQMPIKGAPFAWRVEELVPSL